LGTGGTESNVSPATLREEASSPSRTLEKGLQVLSLFDVAHPEWTLKDIRETAGLPKATGFRLVKTLENLKYLTHDPAAGVYRLGSAMMKAAYLTQTNAALVGIAQPFMRTLAGVTTETVDISVPTDQGAMIVHTIYTARPFRPYNPPGMTMAGLNNVHCKLFAAYRPASLWGKALADNVALTQFSITDPQRLTDELAETRRAGVAFGIEEHKLGMCAVGAPVFSATGDVRAALAVVIPVERFGETERHTYADAVVDAATRLSRELGWTEPHNAAM
jgi:DNA-binding IclR family transcriptional regulator